MKHVDYKVEGGKLLRIDLELCDDVIEDVTLKGDFFIYPEEGISILEESIKGVKVGSVKEEVERTIESEGIKVIGFTPEDLEKAVEKAIES